VGSAPCYLDDYHRAKAIFPDAFVALVNGACTEIEEADAIVAGHTNKAEKFTAARRAVFPNSKFEVYANCGSPRARTTNPQDYPSVTKWFGPEVSTGATSAAKAARMMLALGYEPVVLCGCPLDGSGYFSGESQKGVRIPHDCRRAGDPVENEHRTIIGYREKFRKLAEREFKGKVFSMSGLTRDLLGEPV
jgi:hypothetical protein